MALFGNVLRKTNAMPVTSPSIFQMIRCFSELKVFVGGVGQATDDTSLREAFSAFGEVSNARVRMNKKTGKSRGFGYVTFADPESASAAIAQMHRKELHGRKVSVCYTNARRKVWWPSFIDKSKIFVGGMSHATNDTNLREAFSAYGEVSEARVIMDRKTGKSRGFGFVTFECLVSASDAIHEMDQWELHGRTVTVCTAIYKYQRACLPGSTGYNGYGGGGGSGYCGFDNYDFDAPVLEDDFACT